jgi:protein-S-isoprenylcysteine O-methyltransferase Ste14
VSTSSGRLKARAATLLGVAVLLVGGLFFGSAGTLDYWQAWVFLGVLFLPMTFVLVYLLRRDPQLLERRLRAREQRSLQGTLVRVASLFLLLAFVIPGLSRRFGWPMVPAGASLVAAAVVLLGYGLFFLVLRENSYAARTVEVEVGQRVVTTGPYRTLRHPMHVAVLLMYLFSPLALGSAWAMLPTVLLVPVIVARIQDEERVLEQDLAGYRDYQAQTPFRLIPGVW